VKGEEHRTEELVKKIMNEKFGTDHNGLPGNDDCGTISAWFIFSAMGFYPDCPATDYYTLGYPLFEKVTIKLNPKYHSKSEIVIQKESKRQESEIYFNNDKIDNFRVNHYQLTTGGVLLIR
jgi:putative alpha-1,2-mannosidase